MIVTRNHQLGSTDSHWILLTTWKHQYSWLCQVAMSLYISDAAEESAVAEDTQCITASGSHQVSLLLQVDKLEQSDTMRSEEEQRAEEKPIVLSK